MSVVAVKKYKDRIEIGADSQITKGQNISKDNKSKLYKVGENFSFGGVGMCAMFNIFREFSLNHLPKENTEYGWFGFISEFKSYIATIPDCPRLSISETSFIVVYNYKIFKIEDLLIREIKDFYAMGSGGDYSLAILYNGGTVEQAVKTACELNIYCEKPVNLITIKKEGRIKSIKK